MLKPKWRNKIAFNFKYIINATSKSKTANSDFQIFEVYRNPDVS